MDTYVVNRDGSNLLKLSEEEARLAPPAECTPDAAKKRCVYTQSGDVWLYDYEADRARRLVATQEGERNPQFVPGEDSIAYQRGNNLYRQSLTDGSVEQLTDIRTGKPDPAEEEAVVDPKKEPTAQEVLKKEEEGLIRYTREERERKKLERERRRRENPRKPYYLPARTSVTQLRLVGGGTKVAMILTETPEGAKTAQVPNYITGTGYSEEIATRTKVGDFQPKSRLALADVKTGEVKAVELPLGEKPKEATVFNLVVSDDGRQAVFLARSTDNKDLWRLALDAEKGTARVLTHDHDDAWIGGPGIYRLGFFGKSIYYQSEVSGYSHLYVQNYSGGEPKALTSGEYEVTDLHLSRDGQRFYLTTSEGSPFERHLWVLDPASGEKRKLTSTPGQHEVAMSPDEKVMADVYSYSNKPPEVYLQEVGRTGQAQQITTSPSPEFLAQKWVEPPIVEIPARDGKKVPGRLYRPANARPNGPAVVFVHGAGYLQNVHRWWSSYFREYMFHHLLMANGYTVLDIDYRASSGYGREWRTGIYRHMGGKDLEDHVDAAQWLVKTQRVNPKKIGIYGGSYGGFITLMAMFTSPDTFAAGAALRPVTDWAHYNHPYTSNILNEPQKDAEAYKRSSPIYHAEGLKGALLICHGMVDVNVHYQDSVRLAQRLIELGKDNWELASYPVEDHAFVEPSSWVDEYRRIFKLFERHLK
jgi:dipeptidyl aminopeptidase/acylaminoacyl peptidase